MRVQFLAKSAPAAENADTKTSWPLHGNKIPMGRSAPIHKVEKLSESGLSKGHGWDDELTFNTQVSSQWDSLVHWQHQKSRLAYNGVEVTKEGLSAASTAENQMPTLDHWHERGGLVARGVLIDVKAWYEAKALADGKTGEEAIFHPFEEHRITVAEIETIAKDQGVQFRPGDVLIIRTGLTEVLENPQPADLAKAQNFQLAGMDGTLESAKWLWNKHFAAVAGDAIAFEALMPIKDDGSIGSPEDLGKSLVTETRVRFKELIPM